jgi:hypothetical protein
VLTLATLLMASTLARQAETTHVLGRAERDLTGDGKPEILRVVGVGPTLDDLSVTFTIESAGKTIYRHDLGRMARTAERDGVPPAQYRAWIKEYFFIEEHFMRPEEYVEFLRVHARLRVAEIPNVIEADRQPSDKVAGRVIWDELQKARVTIFTFSPCGDIIEAIGWNARAGRFYRLLSCC